MMKLTQLRRAAALAACLALIIAGITVQLRAEKKPTAAAAPATNEAARNPVDQSMVNLLDIGGAINVYGGRNGGFLPPDLGATLRFIDRRSQWAKDKQPRATQQEKARIYLRPDDPRARNVPAQPTPKWVNDNTSYVYLGDKAVLPARIAADKWGSTIIAQEKLDAGHVVKGPDGKEVTVIPALMLDGHVEGESKERVVQQLAESKKTLEAARVAGAAPATKPK